MIFNICLYVLTAVSVILAGIFLAQRRHLDTGGSKRLAVLYALLLTWLTAASVLIFSMFHWRLSPFVLSFTEKKFLFFVLHAAAADVGSLFLRSFFMTTTAAGTAVCQRSDRLMKSTGKI